MTDSHERESREPEGPQGPVVNDRRKLDPLTGQARTGSSNADAGKGAAAPGAELPDALAQAEAIVNEAGADAEAQQQLAERTEDLQRLQAEFVNYRARVDRDRAVAGDAATAAVVAAVIPVLDDIDAARQAGDLADGPFASIASKLEAALAAFGVERFGEPGEVFDPARHEALMHEQKEGAVETAVSIVIQPGYKMGDRVIRPARVAVTGPDA
jgi:molecular chaperone GrpE